MSHIGGMGRIKKPLSGEDFVRMMNEQRELKVKLDFPEPPEEFKKAAEEAYAKIDQESTEEFIQRLRSAAADRDAGIHPLEFHRTIRAKIDKILVEYENFFNYIVDSTPRVYESESLGQDEVEDLFIGQMHRFFDTLDELEREFYDAGKEKSQHQDEEG